MVNWCIREAYSGPLGHPYSSYPKDERAAYLSLALDLRRGFDTKGMRTLAISAVKYVPGLAQEDFKHVVRWVQLIGYGGHLT